MLEVFLTLPALAGLTIVLGIDNILAIAVVARRVSPSRQQFARRVGILLALVVRLTTLFFLDWLLHFAEASVGVGDLTFRNALVFVAGVYLIAKSAREIHDRTLPPQTSSQPKTGMISTPKAIAQIVFLDMVCGLDSLVTVVGMAPNLVFMVLAIIVEVCVILFCAGAVSRLLQRFPSVETLAICALLLVGGVFMAEGVGIILQKKAVYAMMAFALFVEIVNLRIEQVAAMRTSRNQSDPCS